ncbi:hypothetical protein GBO17_06895 [Mycobacterium avium subsp. hominissuis]|uniref:hypothetical protein n=1 Tax=Mycobacterium avium TaxID=1764 RepID=UPI001CC61B30|nr:hypothetical protein [Mycobacterium avium]MBZ4558674.1 hypothetical protein [Mycobacterium avium subsp. hominissuis]MBZ4568207.1 hypothetical protein [Mycobacterium avium subsp. hominissuis]MBZ4586836.1 hypothetical protein [Mycobacterium avium subsp. hominissuis]MBZ4625153.1 hypothetical protein [Mycobacterium avium subsp. hominissuis]
MTSTETKPLTMWTCDTCGEGITLADAGKALVTWRHDDQGRGYDFRIVHKNMNDRRCDPEYASGFMLHTELSMFLGDKGLAYALGLLSDGPIKGGESAVRVADFDSFTDLVRRVQTPWYEEARPFWNTEHTQHWLADASESYPYMPDVLERIAKQDLG